jgi:hypothetical protein
MHKLTRIDTSASSLTLIRDGAGMVERRMLRLRLRRLRSPPDHRCCHEEHESGKAADALERRPQLAAAIKAAKKAGGPVIVSKLDRLSRDVHFISGLMVHKVPFIVTELGSDGGSICAAPVRRLGAERAELISESKSCERARREARRLDDRQRGEQAPS